MNPSRFLILAAAGVLALGTSALAFHDSGVAHCNGCHTMHNSQGGDAMNFNPAGTGPGSATGTGFDDLLLFENKTDVCLRCHDGGGGYHIWSADPLTPDDATANRGGGDFVFLEEDNVNEAHGGANNPILGYSTGHNVISAMKGTARDPVLDSSPGGTFSSADLACTSCHDPHGTGSFRLLYQDGQTVGTASFTATVVAEAIGTRDGRETTARHNAYHSGYSAWCGTCHGDFHAGSANLVHPSGEPLGADVATTYAMYNGTSDCIANPPAGGLPCGTGVATAAYLPEVPFEDAATTLISTDGPTSSSRVACMTCHRAHATSAMDAGRWDFNVTGLAEDGHESSSYPIPNPYDEFQRSLCNKCHSQDEFDAAVDFTP